MVDKCFSYMRDHTNRPNPLRNNVSDNKMNATEKIKSQNVRAWFPRSNFDRDNLEAIENVRFNLRVNRVEAKKMSLRKLESACILMFRPSLNILSKTREYSGKGKSGSRILTKVIDADSACTLVKHSGRVNFLGPLSNELVYKSSVFTTVIRITID